MKKQFFLIQANVNALPFYSSPKKLRAGDFIHLRNTVDNTLMFRIQANMQ